MAIDRYSVQVGRTFFNSKMIARKVFDVYVMYGTSDTRTYVTYTYFKKGVELQDTCLMESFVKWANR